MVFEMRASPSTSLVGSLAVSEPTRQAQHLAEQIAREEARLRTLTTYSHGVRIFTWLGLVLLASAAYTYGASTSSRLALALAAAGLLGWLTGYFFAPLVAYYRDQTQGHLDGARARLETMRQERHG